MRQYADLCPVPRLVETSNLLCDASASQHISKDTFCSAENSEGDGDGVKAASAF